MRNIGEVMSAIMKIIPEDYEKRSEVEDSFGRIADSVPYTAPEAMNIRWGQLVQALNAYVPVCQSSPEWVKTLAKVVNGEIDHKEYSKDDFVELYFEKKKHGK
jgi:hypothetical protein